MKRSKHLGAILVLVCIALLLAPPLLRADDLIRCQYTKPAGQEIVLKLDINKPAPGSVIVIQHLPKGIGIEKASPPLQKFNAKKGQAKWLLKGPRPGTITMTMHLDHPVRAGQVSGEVRYRNPATGDMVVMPVMP